MDQNMYGVYHDIYVQMETAVLNLFIISALFYVKILLLVLKRLF